MLQWPQASPGDILLSPHRFSGSHRQKMDKDMQMQEEGQ